MKDKFWTIKRRELQPGDRVWSGTDFDGDTIWYHVRKVKTDATGTMVWYDELNGYTLYDSEAAIRIAARKGK